MTLRIIDPMAGERARAIREGRLVWPITTDPTAGERARELQYLAGAVLVTDPTDPRYGEPEDLV